MGRSELERLLDEGGVAKDLGVLRPDPATKEMTLVAQHPGATVKGAREVAGWDLQVTDKVTITAPPTDKQLEVLRWVHTRTSATSEEAT